MTQKFKESKKMTKKSVIPVFVTVLIYLINVNSGHGQTLFGIGLNAGVKGSGPRVEVHTMNYLRVEGGLNWSRYNIFSNYIGVKGTALASPGHKHNFWIGGRFEYVYGDHMSVERDSKFYSYRINDLSYIVPSVGYSFAVKSKIKDVSGKAFLIDFNLNYRILTNSLNLLADSNNEFQSDAVEAKVNGFFRSSLGAYIGFTFYIGRKSLSLE